MELIVIKLEGVMFVPYLNGLPVVPGELRLATLKDALIKIMGTVPGCIVYQRPSWLGRTSPVTLLDSRPARRYLGGPWAR